MKAKTLKIANLILAFILVLFVVGNMFAWFANLKNADVKLNAETTGGYFAGGNGSKDHPYQITQPNHMYNLAWLQNTGKLSASNPSDTKFYFKLENDVNMGGMVLPPIGNDTYPFVGSFDGGGFTITDLRISTNKEVLTACPVKEDTGYEFSNAVGMFGMTGNGATNRVNDEGAIVECTEAEKEETGKASITNFILDNPKVEVANENTAGVVTKYGSSGAKCAGLAVGYLADKITVQSIGVMNKTESEASKLSVRRAEYTTFNSILGALHPNLKKAVTGGGAGAGAGFGSSYDLSKYADRLALIHANNGASPYLPKLNSAKLIEKGYKMPLTVTDKSTYTGATAKEDPSPQNIGYIAGAQNKLYTYNIEYAADTDFKATVEETGVTEKPVYDWGTNNDKFTPGSNQKITYSWPKDTVPPTFFKRTGDNATITSENVVAMTKNEIAALPKNVQNLLTLKEYDTLRLQTKFAGTLADNVEDNKKYGKWADMDYFGNNYTNVYLPNNNIWFKPKMTGKFRFVIYTHNNGANFTLYKLTRNCDPQGENESDEVYYQRYFSTEITGTEALRIHSENLPINHMLIYVEYDHNDLSCEYVVGNDPAENGAYFLYLDIGTSAVADISDVRDGAVSAVDFIYDGVSIKQTEATADDKIAKGNFVGTDGKLYSATKTSVYFLSGDYGNLVVLAFVRTGGEADAFSVKVYPATGANVQQSQSGATITNDGSDFYFTKTPTT